MDSFKTFMNIFQSAVLERDSESLKEILKDSRKYFQNIAKDDSELVLSILFHCDNGLFSFIDNELRRSIPQKGFDMAIKEAFHLLEFIIIQFTDIFEPYIFQAKEVCQQAVTTRCSALIQKTACSAFSKLIELFNEYHLDLNTTVKKFVSLFHFVDIKERSLLFSILGTIAKYCPENEEIQKCSTIIFHQLRNDFIKQYNPNTMSRSMDIFQVYLDALSNMLDDLPLEIKEKYNENLYKWVKELSHPDKYSVKKVSMRSAINFLSEHMYLFREFVYSDYKYWYDLLIKLVQDKNVQCTECGQQALKRFYNVIGSVLKHKTSDDDKAIFLYFKNLFEEQLQNSNQVNSNMLRFIVYGFSQMAAPCKRYLTNEDVKSMFSLVANCAMPLCSRDNTDKTHLESICDYQEPLSEIILHTSDLSLYQINIIIKLSILLVKRFPDLPISSQNLAISSLINTIINIGIINRNFLEEFLYNLIYEGITWACSHTLLVDAELQRALKNLPDRPMCYKNYLPLWLRLLNPFRYKGHRQIAQTVVDSIIYVGITLIEKLNLKTKMKEDNVFSDVAYSQMAENETDFRMFVNIVDLYVDIMNDLESSLLVNTIDKFLLKVISMSYKHHLVSGFYKLVHATFKHISNLNRLLEDKIEAEVLKMLHKYLINVVNLVLTFSGELLTTCLHLILDIPMMYLDCILDSSIPAFKIAFAVGISDFELACTALNTLEKWKSHLSNQSMTPFLQEIVPVLEPYLHSRESSVEFLQDIIKTERKVIKQIILRDDSNTLEKFQARVLLFIASLDFDIIMNFIYKRSMDTGATWDKKDLLKYSLTFSDTQLDIYFDKILPRLLLLAQNSGDRQTKIIACEVLHSIIAFVLGKTSQHLASNPDRFVPIYVTLYPALLKLGCDYDETARKIFQPLTLQLTHWLSSKFMLKSPATTHFVDSLFVGLNNDTNSSLREFSGICLAEFTKWSIKQSDNEQISQLNIDEVIYKMTNFALHPSASKRIAAATAFNHLYTILREDEHIVSVHWLEILYSFVKSLDGCNDPSIITALDHIERVLIAKKNLLNAEHRSRRKPYEFQGSTFRDAVNWLFAQCGSLDRCCRVKCMELVLKFSKHVANCDSVKTLIDNYINTYGIEKFNLIILNNLKRKAGLSNMEGLCLEDLLPLLRSLDCYIWLLKDIQLEVKYLFGNSSSERELIFDCASNFVCTINRIEMEDDKDELMLSKEAEDLQTLQCKTILTIFNFVEILLDSNFQGSFFPQLFFDQDFCELIVKCIMCPQRIGFNAKNFEIAETLSLTMKNLMCAITRTASNSLLELIKPNLLLYVNKHINNFINLDKIISDMNDCNELKYYVRGLTFLKNCNVFDQLYSGTEIFQSEDKIKLVFKVLVKEWVGKLICANIKPSVKDYLDVIMVFLLKHYKPSITKTLIELIRDDTILESSLKEVKHGTHFLNTFKNEIFRYLLEDVKKTMEMFNDKLQEDPFFVLTIVEQLLLFVQRHKKELHDRTETLADTVIEKFTVFECSVSNLEDRKQKLISIFGIAVHLKCKPIEVSFTNKDFCAWILNQFVEDSDLEYKAYILQNFLVCLVDMTSDTKPELLAILHSLRNNRLDVYPDDFSQKQVKALKVFNCFQKLVTLLSITKSIMVYETIILFAAGIAEHLCNEKAYEYIEKYFSSITTEYVLKSIQLAYKLFMNLNRLESERFDVLHKFLLRSFEFCKSDVVEQFFEKHIKEIHTVICQGFIGSIWDIKQLLISKIGCYELVAIMFAKLPIDTIASTESAITRNAMEDVSTGKELLQSLYSNSLNVRMVKSPVPELKELTRLFHCFAYNCSIAIVSCTKTDEDSYVSIFAENRKKDLFIWENIVNCQKTYNFQQTVKEYPRYRKKLINIRRSLKKKQISNRYSYIYSYDLTNSTLNEGINAYDFNETPVYNKSDNDGKEEGMSLTFEDDELNNHECMPSICGVLTHMILNGISVSPADDCAAMPKWLICFLSSMTSTTYDNIRLFMLRIILNMQTVFQPYAKFLLQSAIHATYSYLKSNRLNYLVVDVIEMLIHWQTSSPNLSSSIMDREKASIQQLWEVIVHRAIVPKTSDISKSVYKYNMNMVKTILEVWHPYLKLPANLDEKMIEAPRAAVYLILICFVNGMERQIINTDDVLEFLERSIENWKDDEETVIQSFECYGLVLKHLGNGDALTNKKCAILDKIRNISREMQASKMENRLMKCIRALCKNYPSAAMNYFEFVTPNIFKVDAQGKQNCLKIFILSIPHLSVDQVLKELSFIKLKDLLKNRFPACEKIALRIIRSLVPILPPEKLSKFTRLVPLYKKHELAEYREIAYGIFIDIYKKYVTAQSESNDVTQLINVSTETLLKGVLDPTESLRETILNFWTQDAALASTCKERLLDILDTYTSQVGQDLLPFVLLMMLDLVKKSRNYTQKMFEPLHECVYTDYRIALSWRTKNIGSRAPLFVPSLTSQMNQMFTQPSAASSSTYTDFAYARSSYDSNAELQLRATQEPEFEPTYPAGDSVATYSDFEQQEDTFKVPRVPEPAYNRKSKRFLSSSSDISANIRQNEIKKNIQHATMIKEEADRQRSSIKLYRKYRIGDFPDIEISHAALIEPLLQLANNDQQICKDLTVSIICSLVEDSRSDTFAEALADSVECIVKTEQRSSYVVAAVLEILLNTGIPSCSSQDIAKVSRLNSLNFHGLLVIEKSLIYESAVSRPSRKATRNEAARELSSEWLQLTSLYETMNDTDVVLSIFQNHINDENLRAASFAQASNNWEKAKAAYEQAYETESELVKEYSLQGMFECLSNLCCWEEVDRHLRTRLNGDLDNIWIDPWKEWMLPWLMDIHVRNLFRDDNSDKFCSDVQVMQSWLCDENKVEYIKRLFGNELSMFLRHSDIEIAREFLLNTVDETREQWIKLHPLSTELRIKKLQELRISNDLDKFTKVVKTMQPIMLSNIIQFWNNTMPNPQDAIIPWDKLTCFRIHFIEELLNGDLGEDSQDESRDSGIARGMKTTAFNARLKMIEMALSQGNKYIAKKYAQQLERVIEQYSRKKAHKLSLMCAKTKHLMGDTETNVKEKLSNYTSSWRFCHELLQHDDLDIVTNVHTRRQISALATKIAAFSEENETFSTLLMENDTILRNLQVESNDDLPNIRMVLGMYSFEYLKSCCETDMEECYFVLSKYCYDRLSRGACDVELSKEFVRSILKAMSHGSLKAAHYFPCLLKPEYFDDEETKQIFLSASQTIQPWLFLSWQAELFSHLGTSIARLVIPILKRIVQTYPNAVIYTILLTVDTNRALLNETRTYEIRQLLYSKPEIERFLKAMQYVVQPELYLLHYLSEFRKNLSLGTATAVDILLKRVYPSERENKGDPKPGSIFNEISAFKSKIKELENKSLAEIAVRMNKMIESIRQLLNKRKNRLKLQDYSPWLCHFPERDIEIPGQYTGNRQPIPKYHTKIIKFESTVKVMQSLRKPIRITMIGNDAKEYHFLTKFGEDLRQDQKLQQLFGIMNKTLETDTACKQRQLSIDTYQVIPLSKTVGLIQWKDNTRSLQELIYFSLSKQEVNRYDSIPRMYEEWIQSVAPAKKQYERYNDATLKYSASKVITKMNELIGKTEWDSLRTTLKILCPSIENFVTMRRNFITSYATMCTAHWILGIGDRHLQNTLITIHSGRCLGIDFGLAFDAGVDQRIPELMPFRLTPQILGLLKPFTEKDLLRTIMTHVLRAVRNEQGPILACMDVFVHEPLNWTEHVNKALKESDEELNNEDIKWIPKKKIEAVKKKLSGIKPSLITLDQLREQHNDKYFDRYYTIVIGNDDVKRTRMKMKDNFLTPAEQVECLLDQATDLNILGRTFVGWKPWL